MIKKKLTYWSILLCIILLAVSCGKESEDGMEDNNQVTETGFTINSSEYHTENAYLIFHTVLQYDLEQMIDVIKVKNHFSFLFMDGKAIINDGDILYSIDTKQSSYHNFRDIGNIDLVDNIESIAIIPETYTQSPSSTTRIDISDIVGEVTEGGVSYGDPTYSGINYPLSNEDDASLKINNIEINYDTMTGTVACEYSISSGLAAEAITGKYVGTFTILIE